MSCYLYLKSYISEKSAGLISQIALEGLGGDLEEAVIRWRKSVERWRRWFEEVDTIRSRSRSRRRERAVDGLSVGPGRWHGAEAPTQLGGSWRGEVGEVAWGQ